MRNPIVAICVAFGAVGCVDNSDDLPSRIPGSPTSISVPVENALKFALSANAMDVVRSAFGQTPEATHLVVSVDVDDEKYCTGFHYNLAIEHQPDNDRFLFTEFDGLKIAIEKDDLRFLNGTTLDFATLASGERGFVFRNPNENVSIPDELK